ncbi:MAG TPA: hypothetical protein VGH96_05930 [Streptosporangiaceae bacterium]
MGLTEAELPGDGVTPGLGFGETWADGDGDSPGTRLCCGRACAPARLLAALFAAEEAPGLDAGAR